MARRAVGPMMRAVLFEQQSPIGPGGGKWRRIPTHPLTLEAIPSKDQYLSVSSDQYTEGAEVLWYRVLLVEYPIEEQIEQGSRKLRGKVVHLYVVRSSLPMEVDDAPAPAVEKVKHHTMGTGTRFNGDVTRIEWENGRVTLGWVPDCKVLP